METLGKVRVSRDAQPMMVEASASYASVSNEVVVREVASIQGCVWVLRSHVEICLWSHDTGRASELVMAGGTCGVPLYPWGGGPGWLDAGRRAQSEAGNASGRGVLGIRGIRHMEEAPGYRGDGDVDLPVCSSESRPRRASTWSATTPRVLYMTGGVPKKLSEDDPEMDGEPMRMQVSRGVELLTSVEGEARRSAPRHMCIKRGDLEKYGLAERCPSCGNQKKQSELCRQRILNELGKGDSRVVADDERNQDIVAKPIEENAKKKATAGEAER